MKEYTLILKVTRKLNRNTSFTLERKASLTIDDEFEMKDILSFEQDIKKILTEVKKAYKNESFIEAELNVASYVLTNEIFTIKDFDSWKFTGYADNDTGLYLAPDTRYTDETHDLWIDFQDGVFESISNL